jgi:hypothetical protein
VAVKMYILIKEGVPTGFALVAAAHASLAAYLRFQVAEEVREWVAGPFRKVACRVSGEEFEHAKAVSDRVVITEPALDGAEVALAFRPRRDWPEAFRHYRLCR